MYEELVRTENENNKDYFTRAAAYIKKLKDAGIIVADPLYRPICPKDAQFFELPHIAFSGRIYLKKIKQMPGFADLI